jgi:prepilin-type N-terminal cleavage/methylation domain-containing protein
MSNKQQTKTGFTLVEMVVVIAIVAVLATMVIGIAAHIDSRKDQKRAGRTLTLLNTALGQFHDYGFSYDKDSDYTAFGFPLDCNGFDKDGVEDALEAALGLEAGAVIIIGAHNPDYSGNEVMYLLLSMVPSSRQTLEKIDKKLITSLGSDKQPMEITIGSAEDLREYQLFRVLDPWGTALQYDYYDEQLPPITTAELNTMKDSKKSFPLVTSAGPDRLFGTDDDITNR